MIYAPAGTVLGQRPPGLFVPFGKNRPKRKRFFSFKRGRMIRGAEKLNG